MVAFTSVTDIVRKTCSTTYKIMFYSVHSFPLSHVSISIKQVSRMQSGIEWDWSFTGMLEHINANFLHYDIILPLDLFSYEPSGPPKTCWRVLCWNSNGMKFLFLAQFLSLSCWTQREKKQAYSDDWCAQVCRACLVGIHSVLGSMTVSKAV